MGYPTEVVGQDHRIGMKLDPGRTTDLDPGRTTELDPGRTTELEPGRTTELGPGMEQRREGSGQLAAG